MAPLYYHTFHYHNIWWWIWIMKLQTVSFSVSHPLLPFLYIKILSTVFSKTSILWRKNTNKMQQYTWFIVNSRCWLLTTVLTCFRHLYAHHQEKRPRVTAYGVYLLVVLDVAVCGTVVLLWGCEHCEGCCSTVRAATRLVEQQPSQCSHPQRSTTLPQTATSNTTSIYTPYAVTRGLFSWWWA